MMDFVEVKRVSESDATHPSTPSSRSQRMQDDHDLRRLGKKPVLKRNFGFLSILGFGSMVMATWEGVLLLLTTNYTNGGFAGSVYGYLFVWVGVLCAFSTMSELASMAPTAGGQYYWVSFLAPSSTRVFFSYVVGWLTVIGWQSIVAADLYLCAQLSQGLMVMNDPTYVPQPWQTVLFLWAALTLAIVVNTLVGRLLPKIEGLILVLHLFGFVGILLPLVYFGPHPDPVAIFTEFQNGGMWPSQGLSFLIGAIGPAWALMGPDGPVHMSEEIENPSRNVPRAIVVGLFLNGALGFSMLLGCLLTISDAEAVFSTPTGYPFMAIFQNAVQTQAGAVTMVAIVVTLTFTATISYAATSSRLTWSFARDRGLPGSRFLSQIERRTTLPIWSICLTAVFSILLSLIVFGSVLAFNDIVSLTISSMYSSYLIGNSLLLWRRVTHQITPYAPYSNTLTNTIHTKELSWGPWRIPEPWGTIVNVVGCAYLLLMLVFSFWPVAAEPDASTMNWSVAMVGATVLFAIIYYLIEGRKSYMGPVVEIDENYRPESKPSG